MTFCLENFRYFLKTLHSLSLFFVEVHVGDRPGVGGLGEPLGSALPLRSLLDAGGVGALGQDVGDIVVFARDVEPGGDIRLLANLLDTEASECVQMIIFFFNHVLNYLAVDKR